MLYEITKHTHMKLLKDLLRFAIGGVFGCFCVYLYRSEDVSIPFVLMCGAGGGLLVTMPVLVLHFQYWVKNKDVSLCLNSSGPNSMRYEEGSQKHEFTLEDIVGCFTHVTYVFANKKLGFYPWDDYCYTTIRLKDGSEFTITSLLLPDLEFPFELPNETVYKSIYCWI